MSEPTITATVTRRKSSKARRDLQATIAQIDALFPALADKPSKQADLLCEKASAIKTLLSLETEERETEQDTRIKELEAGHEADSRRIAELTAENTRLQTLASSRLVEYTPDPAHAAVKAERDALQAAIKTIGGGLNHTSRAEAAVVVAQAHSNIAASVCRLLGVDYENLSQMLQSTQINLRRLQEVHDPALKAIVTEVLRVVHNFPPPAITGPPEADTRSGDERLRDAKLSTRQAGGTF